MSKRNDNKPRSVKAPMRLMPPTGAQAAVSVMEHGMVLYQEFNFLQRVDGDTDELLNAVIRHTGDLAHPDKPDFDTESRVSHWAHIAAGALIALEKLGVGYQKPVSAKLLELAKKTRDTGPGGHKIYDALGLDPLDLSVDEMAGIGVCWSKVCKAVDRQRAEELTARDDNGKVLVSFAEEADTFPRLTTAEQMEAIRAWEERESHKVFEKDGLDLPTLTLWDSDEHTNQVNPFDRPHNED